MPNLAKIWAWIRANGVNSGLEALVNFIGPYAIYTLAKPQLGDVHALMASSAPPILWSIIEFARKRRVDALSVLVLAGIALSLMAFAGGGGVKFLQLREKLVTGLIGLIFLGSAAIGRPLIYQLARAQAMRRDPSQAKELEDLRERPLFRRTMMIMTLVWGAGLTAEAALGAVLVFVLTIPQFLLVSPIIGYGTAGSLGLWTFLFARRQTRIGAALRAAQTAAEAGVAADAAGPAASVAPTG